MLHRILFATLLFATVIGLFSFYYQKEANMSITKERTFEAFEIEQLHKQLAETGRLYLSFLNRSTLSTGLYELKAGMNDPQKPHDEDEVYYILSGKSKFTAGGETVDIQEGSVLFVAAFEEHKFHDIEEDLKVLVFFSAMKPEKD